MQRYSPAFAAMLLLVVSGLLQGWETDRWSTSDSLIVAAERLGEIPESIGEWQSEDLTIPENHLKQAEAVGYLSRRYVHRTTGNIVEALILCGRHGPISVHEPTVCFRGAGFELESAPQRHNIEAADATVSAQFLVGDFTKNVKGVPTTLRTFWTWSANGDWQVPSNPRVAFAGDPFLYKLYVTRHVVRDGVRADEDPASEFLELFLPVVNRTLFEER